MPVKVIIPTPLRQYAEKKESLEVQAKTVAEALAAITSQYGRAAMGRKKSQLCFVNVTHRITRRPHPRISRRAQDYSRRPLSNGSIDE